MRKTPVLTLRREDGRVVADAVVVADSTFRRLRGLLGKKELPSGQGILLRPAWSIHTAFMRFPIDVVFLDPDQVVIKIDPELKPFSTSSCRGAREVVELAAGECARRGLTLGDRVAWAGRSAPGVGESVDTALAAEQALEHEVAGTVLVVSADPRFTKLARFLLESHGLGVEVSAPEQASEAAAEVAPGAVVVDAGTDVTGALRLVTALRVESPAPVVVAREDGEGALPGGIPSFHKWDETEHLVAEVERLAGGHPSDEA